MTVAVQVTPHEASMPDLNHLRWQKQAREGLNRTLRGNSAVTDQPYDRCIDPTANAVATQPRCFTPFHSCTHVIASITTHRCVPIPTPLAYRRCPHSASICLSVCLPYHLQHSPPPGLCCQPPCRLSASTLILARTGSARRHGDIPAQSRPGCLDRYRGRVMTAPSTARGTGR